MDKLYKPLWQHYGWMIIVPASFCTGKRMQAAKVRILFHSTVREENENYGYEETAECRISRWVVECTSKKEAGLCLVFGVLKRLKRGWIKEYIGFCAYDYVATKDEQRPSYMHNLIMACRSQVTTFPTKREKHSCNEKQFNELEQKNLHVLWSLHVANALIHPFSTWRIQFMN